MPRTKGSKIVTNPDGTKSVLSPDEFATRGAATAEKNSNTSTLKRPAPAKSKREPGWYWLGTIAGSLVWNTSIGGVEFSRITEDLDLSKPGRTIRIPKNGVFLKLTQEQLDNIEEDLSHKYIRSMAGGKTGQSIDDRNLHYRKNINDKPLAESVYMKPVSEAQVKFRETTPEAIG